MPLRIPPSHLNAELEEVIERSDVLLNAAETDEYTPVSPAAQKRASTFLRIQNAACNRLFQIPLPIPDINPADAGSIDLFWQLERHQLLINFPAGPSDPITYYGETVAGNQTIAGRTTPHDERPDLIAWLTQTKA